MNSRFKEKEEKIVEVDLPGRAAKGMTSFKVPVDALIGVDGVVAQDVLTPEGSVILPAGVDIAMFNKAMPAMIRKMKQSGITHVFIQKSTELNEDDIESIISRVYSETDSLIDKEKATFVVQGVNKLFNEFKKEEPTSEIITSLGAISEDLAVDLMNNPSVAFSLGKVKDADEYTFIHSFNVSLLCGYLAARLHPNDKEFIQKMVLGGLLHDLGKSQIPLDILNKPGPLSADEFTVMQRHPAIGVSLALKSGVSDHAILSIIGGHHEKWSGKGYPNHKAGLDIPEPARIAAVADVFDALTAKRVYKAPMSSRNAIAIILKDSGVHFDSKVARELLVGLGLYPPGSIVVLSDGRRGIVVSGGGKDLMRPVVLIQEGTTASDTPEFVDLKNDRDLIIADCIGHGGKREMTIAPEPKKTKK